MYDGGFDLKGIVQALATRWCGVGTAHWSLLIGPEVSADPGDGAVAGDVGGGGPLVRGQVSMPVGQCHDAGRHEVHSVEEPGERRLVAILPGFSAAGAFAA